MRLTWHLISGKRYAGKDAFARVIAERCTARRELYVFASFAAAVKHRCADLHNLEYDRLMNDQEYKNTHRQVLIDCGNGMRAIDPDYWIIAMKEYAIALANEVVAGSCASSDAASANSSDNVVVHIIVSDCRFKNELDHFMRMPDTMVHAYRVRATDVARTSRGWAPSSADSDISECDLDHLDVDPGKCIIIDNNGSLADLWEKGTKCVLQMD